MKKITPKNYEQVVSKVDINKMIPEMQEFHNILKDIPQDKFEEWFETDEVIKDCIQFYFDRLEVFLNQKQEPDDNLALVIYTLNLNLRLAQAKLKLLKQQQP